MDFGLASLTPSSKKDGNIENRVFRGCLVGCADVVVNVRRGGQMETATFPTEYDYVVSIESGIPYSKED